VIRISTEVAAVSLSCLKWNTSLFCLAVDWNRIKGQRQGSLNLFPDAMTWERCLIHALATCFPIEAHFIVFSIQIMCVVICVKVAADAHSLNKFISFNVQIQPFGSEFP
jgi:hypothetical protein